jgi:hypothetical protein
MGRSTSRAEPRPSTGEPAGANSRPAGMCPSLEPSLVEGAQVVDAEHVLGQRPAAGVELHALLLKRPLSFAQSRPSGRLSTGIQRRPIHLS